MAARVGKGKGGQDGKERSPSRSLCKGALLWRAVVWRVGRSPGPLRTDWSLLSFILCLALGAPPTVRLNGYVVPKGARPPPSGPDQQTVSAERGKRGNAWSRAPGWRKMVDVLRSTEKGGGGGPHPPSTRIAVGQRAVRDDRDERWMETACHLRSKR